MVRTGCTMRGSLDLVGDRPVAAFGVAADLPAVSARPGEVGGGHADPADRYMPDKAGARRFRDTIFSCARRRLKSPEHGRCQVSDDGELAGKGTNGQASE